MTKAEKITKLLALTHDAEVSFAAANTMTSMKSDDDRYERAREVLKAALEEMIND